MSTFPGQQSTFFNEAFRLLKYVHELAFFNGEVVTDGLLLSEHFKDCHRLRIALVELGCLGSNYGTFLFLLTHPVKYRENHTEEEQEENRNLHVLLHASCRQSGSYIGK